MLLKPFSTKNKHLNMTRYQCVQFGVCSRADKAECFEIDGDFRCGRDPEDVECQSKLEPVSGGAKFGRGIRLGFAVVATLLLGSFGYWLFSSGAANPQAPATTEQLLKEIWPWLP